MFHPIGPPAHRASSEPEGPSRIFPGAGTSLSLHAGNDSKEARRQGGASAFSASLQMAGGDAVGAVKPSRLSGVRYLGGGQSCPGQLSAVPHQCPHHERRQDDEVDEARPGGIRPMIHAGTMRLRHPIAVDPDQGQKRGGPRRRDTTASRPSSPGSRAGCERATSRTR